MPKLQLSNVLKLMFYEGSCKNGTLTVNLSFGKSLFGRDLAVSEGGLIILQLDLVVEIQWTLLCFTI